MGFELLSFVILIVTSGGNLNNSVVKDLWHGCIIFYDARHVTMSVHYPLSPAKIRWIHCPLEDEREWWLVPILYYAVSVHHLLSLTNKVWKNTFLTNSWTRTMALIKTVTLFSILTSSLSPTNRIGRKNNFFTRRWSVTEQREHPWDKAMF